MKQYINRCQAGMFFLLALLGAGLFTACDEEETIPVELSTPVITQEEVTTSTLAFSWDRVEGVSQYVYELRDPNGFLIAGDATTSTRAYFTDLLPGTSYTLSVWAFPAVDNTARLSSPVASLTVTTEASARQLWARKGTFYCSQLDEEWEATLFAYDDGSYKLKSWYGVEGYDLEFTVNDSELEIQNSYLVNSGYYYVYTGRTDFDHREIYTGNGYSFFEGDETGGEFWYYDYDSYGYSQFTWTDNSLLTVDNLVGEWEEHSTGDNVWFWEDYEGAFNWSGNSVTITKVDDQTIEISNFFYANETLTATVNFDERTITIPAGQTFYTYYAFAQEADENAAVVATFSADATSITLSGWSAWCWGYVYVEGASTTLTKK